MKRFVMLILAAALMALMTAAVCAETPRLVDSAGLLSSSEASALEELLDDYSAQYNLDIAVLTKSRTYRRCWGCLASRNL